ncbi:MAG: DUF1566 domain-containing protein [Desulfobulbaceae bacterium]|nr:DUF1566 domain-containing protein [Desulfobulbaceae bacterium]
MDKLIELLSGLPLHPRVAILAVFVSLVICLFGFLALLSDERREKLLRFFLKNPWFYVVVVIAVGVSFMVPIEPVKSSAVAPATTTPPKETQKDASISIHQSGGQTSRVVGDNNNVGVTSPPVQDRQYLSKKTLDDQQKKKEEAHKKPPTIKTGSNNIKREQRVKTLRRTEDEVKQVRNGNLVWQKDIEAKPMIWPEAEEYCRSLELGGYNDWRLPKIC